MKHPKDVCAFRMKTMKGIHKSCCLKKEIPVKVGESAFGEYSICNGLSSQRIVLCCHVNEVLDKIKDFVCAMCTYLSSNLFAHLRKKHKHMLILL